jgi:hydrogenase maturation protease
MATGRILVIGFGNPGRLDDGLGPRLAEAVAAQAPAGVSAIADYSLQVEHATAVAEHDAVVFADAAVSGPAPFALYRLAPQPDTSFSTHSVSPGALLALAGEHFGASAAGYVLAIRGYDFNEFGEWLSSRARANLDAALAFLLPRLRVEQLASHALESATGT